MHECVRAGVHACGGQKITSSNISQVLRCSLFFSFLHTGSLTGLELTKYKASRLGWLQGSTCLSLPSARIRHIPLCCFFHVGPGIELSSLCLQASTLPTEPSPQPHLFIFISRKGLTQTVFRFSILLPQPLCF